MLFGDKDALWGENRLLIGYARLSVELILTFNVEVENLAII